MNTQPPRDAFCIILAGGVGRRLWPASTKQLPKQFIDFFGTGRTLLQQTYDRFARFIPADHILVSTFESYVPLVREQLPDIPESNILPEKVQLSTAPAAIWGTWHVALAGADEACLIVTPADQIVQDAERFEQQVRKGFDYVARHDVFLAMGVRPTLPNTAYGYIQMGKASKEEHLFRVKSFSEKPEENYAKMFVESGEFLWNTGLFMWRVRTMGEQLATLAHRPYGNIVDTARQYITIAEELEFARSTFPSELPRSLDLFILERCANVIVQECDFGWADVGCWTEMRAVSQRDADGNALSGKAHVMFSGASRCMVRLPEGLKAVVCGLDNFLIVQQDDVLMICPNDNPDQIRRLINEAQVNL